MVFPKQFMVVLNIYKDNFKDDYLNSKPNYLISFLIITSIL